MFKKTFFAVFLLLFVPSVFAEVFLVEPFELSVSDQEVVDLGLVAAGDSVQLIVSTDSGTEGVLWDSLSIESTTGPLGWEYSFWQENEKRVSLLFLVPLNLPENVYEIKIATENNDYPLKESFTVRVEVRKNVMQALVSESGPASQDFFVNGKKNFKITLTNPAITNQKVVISSDLARGWLEDTVVEVPRKQTKDFIVPVTARVHGKKNFSFILKSENTGLEFASFDASISAKPTLEGKLSATTFGFPFFSPSLAHVYFFNSIIGSFFG